MKDLSLPVPMGSGFNGFGLKLTPKGKNYSILPMSNLPNSHYKKNYCNITNE